MYFFSLRNNSRGVFSRVILLEKKAVGSAPNGFFFLLCCKPEDVVAASKSDPLLPTRRSLAWSSACEHDTRLPCKATSFVCSSPYLQCQTTAELTSLNLVKSYSATSRQLLKIAPTNKSNADPTPPPPSLDLDTDAVGGSVSLAAYEQDCVVTVGSPKHQRPDLLSSRPFALRWGGRWACDLACASTTCDAGPRRGALRSRGRHASGNPATW